jgi:2'-5' RNA ligase
MRLFLGIELPEPLVGEIGRVQSLLRASRADVRWVEPGNAHLTLKFLGEVGERRVAAIDAALREPVAAATCHDLDAVGIGAFPNEARPRVLWAGVEGAIRELAALQQRVEAALETLGFDREGRHFSPHVTIGRVRRPVHLENLSAAIRELRHEPLGVITVAEVVLFESTLTPKGARYQPRSRYRLGA